MIRQQAKKKKLKVFLNEQGFENKNLKDFR